MIESGRDHLWCRGIDTDHTIFFPIVKDNREIRLFKIPRQLLKRAPATLANLRPRNTMTAACDAQANALNVQLGVSQEHIEKIDLESACFGVRNYLAIFCG